METLTFLSPITTSLNIESAISMQVEESIILTQTINHASGISTSISLEVDMYNMEVS